MILVVGSLNRDLTVEVPRLPRPGETVLGTAHRWDNGGKGANQAVAAARLGREVSMIGRVGADPAGAELVAGLDREGVDTAAVARDPEAGTGLAVIGVEPGGENAIVVSPGANARMRPADVDAGRLAAAAVVLLQLEVPLDVVAAAAAGAAGTVVLNPAPAAALPAALLADVDVLVPNRGELAALAGTGPAGDVGAVAAMAARLSGPGAVVVTLGAAGAVVVEGGRTTHVPAPEVAAVDATAAGDAFCGALADSLAGGASLVDATRWAVTAGAVTATRPGAQSSLPTAAEVRALAAAS